MDNRGEYTQTLIEKVNTKFAERSVPDAQIRYEYLTAKGLVVERRPYFILSRNLVSMGLYISHFGKDLFVSIASYLKPPISNLRVVLLGVMLLFALYTNMILPSVVSSQLNGLAGGMFGGPAPDLNGVMTLLCIFGPLGVLNNLALVILFWYSVYKLLTEKDFLAALRTQPNEFNEDDLMAMEKAVEQTVRISIDEIGLDPSDLKPIGSGMERRLI